MSIAGGIENAFYAGASIGCTAIQFFSHSNRQWTIKNLSPESIEAVEKAKKATHIDHATVHASYLINLGSASSATVKKSKEALIKELHHCSLLSIPLLVLHPGAGTASKKAGLRQVAEVINEIFEETKDETMIALELMAGQGTSLGSSFDELAEIRQLIHHKKRIGFCIDTCHLWAAGYDFSSEKKYHEVWKDFNATLGYEHLKVIHLNDSKKGLNSHVDRHADIGEGTIGIEAFRLLMNDSHLASIPKILETPSKTLPGYAHNMKILLDLIHKKR